MKYCSHCGAALSTPNANFCLHCGERLAAPVVVSQPEYPTEKSLKYCSHCGSAISDSHAKFCLQCGEQLVESAQPERKHCPNCGRSMMGASRVCMNCGYTIGSENKRNNEDYDHCVWNAWITNIIAVILLAIGVLCGLAINIYLGAVFCLAGELVALIPNTKLQKEIKRNNPHLARTYLTQIIKDTKNRMKGRYAAFHLSLILAIVCLVTFILLFALYYYIGAIA